MVMPLVTKETDKIMIKLKNILNEGRLDIGLAFKDGKDYDEFKKDARAHKISFKDLGKQKHARDLIHWAMNVSSSDMRNWYGPNWADALEGDYESVLIS